MLVESYSGILSKRALPYREGDWFAVPLTHGGYGIGLIARVGARGGIVLGYFFGPRRNSLPSATGEPALHAIDAILICQFCNPALMSGEWAIVSRSEEWHREEWPQPAFGHVDAVDSDKAYKREYPDNNPSDLFIRETPISLEEARLLPKDGLYGHIALQKKLTFLLSI